MVSGLHFCGLLLHHLYWTRQGPALRPYKGTHQPASLSRPFCSDSQTGVPFLRVLQVGLRPRVGVCMGREGPVQAFRGRGRFCPVESRWVRVSLSRCPFRRKLGVGGLAQAPALLGPTVQVPGSLGASHWVWKREGPRVGERLKEWGRGHTPWEVFTYPRETPIAVCACARGLPRHSPGGACAFSQAAPPSVQLCWALAAPPCRVPPPAPLPPVGTDTACEAGLDATASAPPPHTAALPGLCPGGPSRQG